MKTFISAASIKPKKERINKENLDKFIDKFNKSLKRGDIYLNTGLNGVPFLNDNEFARAVKLAKKEGWTLTRFEDNYQTTTYKIEKISE